jgi:hypothetical protein
MRPNDHDMISYPPPRWYESVVRAMHFSMVIPVRFEGLQHTGELSLDLKLQMNSLTDWLGSLRLAAGDNVEESEVNDADHKY